MAAHLPEARRAIHGRTHDRTWQPEAVEHHRRAGAAIGDIAMVALLLLFVVLVAAGLA